MVLVHTIARQHICDEWQIYEPKILQKLHADRELVSFPVLPCRMSKSCDPNCLLLSRRHQYHSMRSLTIIIISANFISICIIHWTLLHITYKSYSFTHPIALQIIYIHYVGVIRAMLNLTIFST